MTDSNSTRLLIYGIGNKSRGDDGLGPTLTDWLASQLERYDNYELTLETPFQLQPENIYDFEGNDAILFLDADISFNQGVQFKQLQGENSNSPFVSHALSPTHLLHMHNDLLKHNHPSAYLISIGAEQLELGEGLSDRALGNLQQAKKLLNNLLNQAQEQWPQYFGKHPE